LKFQQTQKIEIKDLHTDKENIVEVKAECSIHSNEVSHVLATFKFRPIENAEFKLEDDLDKGKDDDRWPRGNTEKYEQMVQDICKMQNFTSLRYHRLDDLLESIGIDPDNICTYCFNGKE